MPRMPRSFIHNACYHLIVRGSQGKTVFTETTDCLSYLQLVHKYKLRYRCLIYGYCLMRNHVHLIAEFPEGVHSMSKFMHCLNQAYAMKFNRTYNQTGHLWQNRYKNFAVLKNEYLLNLVTYIEYNPVRAKIVSKPEDYQWSSYKYSAWGPSNIVLDPIII